MNRNTPISRCLRLNSIAMKRAQIAVTIIIHW
jgi:hypothetical protein